MYLLDSDLRLDFSILRIAKFATLLTEERRISVTLDERIFFQQERLSNLTDELRSATKNQGLCGSFFKWMEDELDSIQISLESIGKSLQKEMKGTSEEK